jgi:hypothetical protein
MSVVLRRATPRQRNAPLRRHPRGVPVPDLAQRTYVYKFEK